MYKSRTQRNRARRLRSNMTDAEVRLWTKLQHQQLGGHKFRRQVSIGPHIVDFACLKQRLLIEVDGGQHNQEENKENDAARDAWLASEGYRVLRFWNHDVLADTDAVLEVIWQALQQRPEPPPRPSPQGGGSS
jgi:very-short-patch-repair endonuclease